MTVSTKESKIHFHLYLDVDTAAWLRKQREENFMPISTSVALAVREYRLKKAQAEDEE